MQEIRLSNNIGTDCGAPFNSNEWKIFAKEHNIEHAPCTPHHHEANGLVESFMKNLTKQRRIAFIDKTNYFERVKEFLAHYRATPHSTTGKSPSSLFLRYYAHHTRLPRPACSTRKEADQLDAEERDRINKLKGKLNKERIGFFGVKQLKVGDEVRLRIKEKQKKNRPVLTTEIYEVINTHKHKIFVKRKDGKGKVLERDEADVEFAIQEEIQSNSDCEIIGEVDNNNPDKRLTIRNGAAIRMHRGGWMRTKGIGRGEKAIQDVEKGGNVMI